MKRTEAITVELLNRWQRGERAAALALLFHTGLWDRLLEGVPESLRDAAKDAILRAFDELQRRGQIFTPECFLEVFRKQYGRRRRDLVIAELRNRQKTLSLDRPWSSTDHSAHEGDLRIELLESYGATPEQQVLAQIETEIALATTQRFCNQLSATYRDHLEVVERGLARIYSQASPEIQAAILLDWLHIGRAHHAQLAAPVIAACCGNRKTYDTHNRRIRRAWQSFLMKEIGPDRGWY